MVVAAMVSGAPGHAAPAPADPPSLAGRWTLNRDLSQFPRDVGFGMDLASVAGAGSDSAGASGGRGRSQGGTPPLFRESADDAKRTKQLVDAVRNPSPHLTIVQTETTVTITDDRGRSLTFHPDGKQESQMLDQVPVATTTRWEGARLVVRYNVQQNRELRYTFSRSLEPSQLVVQVEFIERGGHDTVTRVYEPARADEPAVPDRAAPPAAATRASDLDRPAAPASPGQAAAPGQAAPPVAQGPDPELKGLTKLGFVVEDLSAQAAACGLSQAPIEAAVSKSLSDAGFTARRNSDEDTYVYVHIITMSVSAGLCVSRYDAFLYTYTTATLSYQASPLLVQVSLLHKGGLAGGGPSVHGDTVLRGVKQYVDEFAARIRGANR